MILFCLNFRLSALFHDFLKVWNQGDRIIHGMVRVYELKCLGKTKRGRLKLVESVNDFRNLEGVGLFSFVTFFS